MVGEHYCLFALAYHQVLFHHIDKRKLIVRAQKRYIVGEILSGHDIDSHIQHYFDLIDLAAFYYDYKDIQVRSNVSFGVTAVENAASAKIKGIEIGVTARPVSFLTFGANLAYLDARYGVFCQPISGGTPQGSDPLCAAGIANRFGNRLNQAPEWSGNMFASIELPAGDAGKVKANANFAWESNVYYSTSNIASVSSGGWHSLDARFGFEIANGPELFVFGKNLTNDRYISWSAQATATILAGSVNAPRTYGVGVEYHF